VARVPVHWVPTTQHRRLQLNVHKIDALLAANLAREHATVLHVRQREDVSVHWMSEGAVRVNGHAWRQTRSQVGNILTRLILAIPTLHVEVAYPVQALEPVVVSARGQNIKHTILLLGSNHLPVG
jgi:hypothetical protein